MFKLFAMLSISLYSINGFCVFDDHDIKGKVDIEGFFVGSDSDLGGSFSYIVDRTTGLCFASLGEKTSSGIGSSITQVSCDSLKKVKAIDQYIKTGKISK